MDELTTALETVAGVVADLEAATPRLTLTANYGERTSSGSKTAPAPVNIDAVSAKHELHTWLLKTALRIGEPFSRRDPASLAAHLITHMPLIDSNGWASTLTQELQPLINQATRITTQTRPQFAGTCQTPNCKTELWTTPNNDNATCKTCGTQYTQIRSWRTQARTYAQNTENNIQGYPNTLAQRLAAIHGETITPEHIRLLASKGLLTRANPERGTDGKKLRAMYRLGDIKALIREKDTA